MFITNPNCTPVCCVFLIKRPVLHLINGGFTVVGNDITIPWKSNPHVFPHTKLWLIIYQNWMDLIHYFDSFSLKCLSHLCTFQKHGWTKCLGVLRRTRVASKSRPALRLVFTPTVLFERSNPDLLYIRTVWLKLWCFNNNETEIILARVMLCTLSV